MSSLPAFSHVPLARATGLLPAPPAQRYAVVLTRENLELGLYAPRGVDDQNPHAQHEVYVVVHGSGTFVAGDERVDFGPGDALFVAAGVVHRFERFSDDLTVWVMFY